MNHSALEFLEKKQDNPILIVDKTGNIGEALAKELKDEFLIVFVSQKTPEAAENIIHIPYLKKIPTMPDNTYSYIFVIDDDTKLTREVFEQFAAKAEKDNAYLTISVNHRFVNENFLQSINFTYDKFKLAILGDVFATNYIYNLSSEINKFIYQAKKSGKLEIPGDGTRETFPVLLSDAVSAMMEVAFGNKEANKIYYIFSKQGITFLTLFRILKKLDPMLMADFVKVDAKQENFIFPKEGEYVLEDPYEYEEKIKKIDFNNLQVDKSYKPTEYKTKSNEQVSKRGAITAICLFVVFLLLLPFLSTVLFSTIGAGYLYKARSDLENGISSSGQSANLAVSSFNLSLKSSGVLNAEVNTIGLGSKLNGLIDNITFGNNIAIAAASLINSSENYKSILMGKSNVPKDSFINSSIDLKNALVLYDKELEKGLIPKKTDQKITDLKTLLSSTIDFWPDIVGLNGQKTYLVLFQNNMELRSGGGFIGSFAILSVNNAKISNFKIYDVYDADGQLKGHVEPPFFIRRYLPSIHWFLRDSNTNVDFSKGAVASAVFLNSEMQQQVDGVIGVDLSFVRNLLSVTGPVRVADYNETVNADNFFQIAQSHAQKDFFPGSTQKKDFLNAFYNSLGAKLSEEKNISYLGLLQALSSSIYEKHILFAFNNTNEEAAFSLNGWSSSLVDERSEDNNTLNDFFGINEANLGGNKVNYYISRSISQNVSIADDGAIKDQATIAFKNSAPSNLGANGVYKNYLRIILPFNSKISKIQINGTDEKIIPAITDPAVYEKKNFVPPQGLEVWKQDQGKNTIYGFFVVVEPQDLKTIKIDYFLDKKLNLSNSEVVYSLKIFKQPGVDSYPYGLALNFPKNLKKIDGSSDFVENSNREVLSDQITRDRTIFINLAKK